MQVSDGGPPRPTGTDQPSIRDQAGGPGAAARPPGEGPVAGDPIDIATGDVVMMQADVQLAGVLPLVLSRTHVSSYRVGRWFGPSWASTLDQRLEVDSEGVWFASADGMLLRYPLPGDDGEPVWPVVGPRLSLAATMYGYEISDRAQGYVWQFQRSGDEIRAGVRSWPLTTIGDRNGNRIDLEYDQAGWLTGVRHSGGYHVRVETTGARITALSLGDRELVRYGYDASRQLTEVYNSSGQPMVFDYDPAGRMISWTDRIGGWYRYDYDASGRCTRTTGADGVLECRLSYDPESRTTSVTDSLGNTTRYVYNEGGRVVRQVDPLDRVTVMEWDGHGRLLSRTDPLGRTIRNTYDADGNLIEFVRADGARTTATYNEFGLPTTVTDPAGGVRQIQYDQRGNAVAVTDPAGGTVRYGYDQRGHLVSSSDPLGNIYRVQNDAAGMPLAVTDPTGAVTRYERDALGQPVAEHDPAGGVHQVGWTPDGLLDWRATPEGATERWRYDAEGNLVERTDAAGNMTRLEIGQFGVPTARIDPDGTRLAFDYDTELRLIAVTNPQGLRWTYTYDAAGQLATETDFNGHTITYTYDQAGQLIGRTSGTGETTHYRRDPAGNIIEQRTGQNVTTFRYDAVDRLIHAHNGDAELTYTRDALGQIRTETCNGATVASQFDPAGRRTHRVTPSGAETRWQYDPRGLPVSMRAAGHLLAFDYDPAGREIHRRLDGTVHMAQSWNANSQLLTQTLTAVPTAGAHPAGTTPPAAGRTLQSRNWHYRPDGYLVGVDDSHSGPRRFDLDPAGRTTAVHGTGWSERYVYDPAGNLTDATWPADAPPDPMLADARGQREYAGSLIARAGKIRYEHDARGRVTLRQHRQLSTKPRSWRYTWDDERLVSVTTPDGSVWRYRYDPLGRRIAKQRLDTEGDVVEQITFVWDGPVLAEQTHHLPDRPGEPARERTTVWDWQPGTFRPLTQTEHTSLRDAPQEIIDERFYAIITDLIGTPTELYTPDGEVAWRHETNVWGTTIAAPAGPADCPLRFPGQYHDPETGTSYNVFRYYDPSIGRYQTLDPLGLAPAPNPNAYVPNPQQQTDPLGLASTICTTGIPPRPANSPLYSVAYEAQLPATAYPGRSRAHHFSEANRQLHEAFESDPRFARDMDQLYPGIVEGVRPGPRGGFPRQPPIPGTDGGNPPLVWHHHPTRPGVLQLIPTEHHQAGGAVQSSLHPDRRGGMENWGGRGR